MTRKETPCGCIYEIEPGRTALMERCAFHRAQYREALREELEAGEYDA